MNEFIEQFLIEARELQEQATDDLLALEQGPADRARLDGAFRALHTLKGAAGIVEFAAMGRAMHAAEDRLAALRAGTQPADAALIGDCLACLRQVGRWLEVMEATGAAPADADATAEHLIARLARNSGTHPPWREAAAVALADAQPLANRETAVLREQIALLEGSRGEGFGGRLAAAGTVAVRVFRHLGWDSEAAALEAACAASLEAADPTPLLRLLAARLDPASPADADAEAGADAGAGPARPIVLRALRVDISRVDAIVELTGELTVVKNAFGHLVRLAQDGKDAAGLAVALKQQQVLLERLTAELQHSALALRVLPLREVFRRFAPLLREMAASLGKSVRLETEGEATEADKAVVEALFEPLLHVLRNAVDHGVEPAAARAASGKPATAVIRLRGWREGEKVIIEVADDGAGLDLADIRRVAIARGLIAADGTPSDDELANLVFAPGFSTSSAVTDLSGRGVGMDAARAAVERLGGRVTLQGRPGAGTTVRFVLPLTVMMTPVMTVEAAGQTFGVPFDTVLETVQLERDKIIPIGASQAFVLRGRTVPLLCLARALALSSEDGMSPGIGAPANIVVTEFDGQLAGLQVDRVGSRLDVILKPMDGLMVGMHGIAGTTVLGDGRVLIVLDLPALLR